MNFLNIACSTRSTCVKDANTEGANIESASTKDVDIKTAYSKGTCIRDTSTCSSDAYFRA